MTASRLFTSDPYQTDEGLWVIGRREFADKRFDYEAGDHVVFGGPTTAGKTTLAFALLGAVATPELPAYVAVSKPRDPATEREGRALGFRRVSDWPVPRQVKEMFGGEKPRGYLIWPKFGDINTDVERSARITRTLLAERYAAGARNKKAILVMDDTMVKSKILGLDREMTTVLAMASSMNIGIWVFVQKPTSSGSTAIWSYEQAEHIFISAGRDKRNLQRYDEIGGFDRRFVSDILSSLTEYQFLYIKRTGRFICIVDAQ